MDNKIKKPIIPPTAQKSKSNPLSSNVTLSKKLQDDIKSNKPMTNYILSNKIDNKTIVTSQNVITSVARPKNKKRITSTIIIVALIVLILLSTLLFIFVPKATRPNDINIDFNVKATLTPSDIGGGVGSDKKAKLMPGDDMKCTFEITSSKNDETDTSGVNLDVYVRMKVYAVVEDNYYSNIISIEMIDLDKWYRSADNYFYYRGKLSPNQVLQTAKKIHLEKSIGNEFSGKTLKIVFLGEALQAEYQAISELWATAPYEWAKEMKSL